MSILKSFFATKDSAKSGPETAPVKMNLEERMAFRREMLYEAIKVTMQASGVLSASYKFRVVRNDKRGHQYSVMIDLSTDFLANPEGQPARLAAVGANITRNAMARYGIVVAGIGGATPDPARKVRTRYGGRARCLRGRVAKRPGASCGRPHLFLRSGAADR